MIPITILIPLIRLIITLTRLIPLIITPIIPMIQIPNNFLLYPQILLYLKLLHKTKTPGFNCENSPTENILESNKLNSLINLDLDLNENNNNNNHFNNNNSKLHKIEENISNISANSNISSNNISNNSYLNPPPIYSAYSFKVEVCEDPDITQVSTFFHKFENTKIKEYCIKAFKFYMKKILQINFEYIAKSAVCYTCDVDLMNNSMSSSNISNELLNEVFIKTNLRNFKYYLKLLLNQNFKIFTTQSIIKICENKMYIISIKYLYKSKLIEITAENIGNIVNLSNLSNSTSTTSTNTTNTTNPINSIQTTNKDKSNQPKETNQTNELQNEILEKAMTIKKIEGIVTQFNQSQSFMNHYVYTSYDSIEKYISKTMINHIFIQKKNNKSSISISPQLLGNVWMKLTTVYFGSSSMFFEIFINGRLKGKMFLYSSER